jgi:magnesium-transporting ATPase (P-type)
MSKRNTISKKKQSVIAQLPFSSNNQRNLKIIPHKNSMSPIEIEADNPVDTYKAKQMPGKKYITRASDSLSHMTGRSATGINNATARQRLRNSQNTPTIKHYDNEFRLTINKIQKAETILCVSGKSFQYVYMRYKQDKSDGNFQVDSLNNILMNLIRNQGKIFHRMNPNDKVDLINFLKEDKNNIVAMCGDGANDCGALLTADVGISVGHSAGNSVTSHFYSNEESIRCVELIIRNGRACLENSMVNLKYMVIYALIQFTSVLCLNTVNLNMSVSQYLYCDCVIALITSLLAITTGVGYSLSKENPPNTILNCRFITSTLGHVLIQCVTQVFYFWFFMMYRVDLKLDQYEYQQQKEVLIFPSVRNF